MTLFVMTVSACTTPLNWDIAAFTVTMAAVTVTMDALMLQFALAETVTLPATSMTMRAPLVCCSVTVPPAASSSVRTWPPCVLACTFSAPGCVVECQLVAGTGGEATDVVVGVHRLGRVVLAVPQRADHHRVARVAGMERDQYLIAGLWDEPASAVVAGHAGGQSCPGLGRRRIIGIDERQFDLDAALMIWVLHVAHNRRIYAMQPGARERHHHALGIARDHDGLPRSARDASKCVR